MEATTDIFGKAVSDPGVRKAAGRLAAGQVVQIAAVWGSSGPLVAAALGQIRKAPVLLIAGHLDDADEIADDVEVLTGRPAQQFSAWEVDIGTEHLSDEVAGERLRLCNQLAGATGVPSQRDETPAGQGTAGPTPAEPPMLLVAPIMALLQPVPTRQALSTGRRTLARGGAVDLEELLGWLVEAGFEHVEQVDQQGQFAHRGGILDVFPLGTAEPVRVELFGDQIDSIRRFDLDSQRSIGELDAYDITALPVSGRTDAAKTTHLLSYLPPDTIICMIQPEEIRELADEIHQRLLDSTAGASAGAIRSPQEIFAAAGGFAQAHLHLFAPRRSPQVVDLGVRSLERLSINTHEALTELGELSASADVWVFCENPAEEKRFRDLIGVQHPDLAKVIHTAQGHLHNGFHWPAQKLVAVGHHEVFHRYARVRRIRRVRTGRPIDSLLDLQEGDYVVHVSHGIARFQGLRSLTRDGHSEEYLRLEFADKAILHVPAASIDLVQKYIGTRRVRPSLSKLGGVGWARQKAKVSEAIMDLAADMIRTQAMRQAMQGISYPVTSDWQKQFCEEFLYTETEDQLTAMQQIDADMAAVRPMDRLLCGDVGYGKTELAMRAAFKTAEAGKQAAILVPTTVLADQHYRTFQERFADYPFQVEVISRFRTHAQQQEILLRLAAGDIDVLIGTHRMLSQDVSFADLGLVIIDEEQRFGVEHKERLKALRATVDVLTMTATPIPRTLHMALLGLRDISSLSTPPLDRRSIHTEVSHYDDKLIRQSILRELNRGGQVFLVHNRVMDIEFLADHVRKLVPECRVIVGHGQMPEGQLEETMTAFVNGRYDVLVCTTIIESGLDIPTANTMLIHNADRFGLAELHQLRGRVGRYKHRAFCYLLLPQDKPVSAVASKRLKTIEEFSDLGAGFQIAMRDLEIRGAGNLLGMEQSGHIATVGYELYCQLLDKAVRQLKGEPAAVRHDVHVEVGIDAYLPRSYVPSDRQRMEIYRRLVRCASHDELSQLSKDLADAYGPVPEEAQTVLDLAEIRVRAAVFAIASIVRIDPDLVFAVRDMRLAQKLFDGATGTVRLADEKTIHWRLPPVYFQNPTLVRVLLKRLRDAQQTDRSRPAEGPRQEASQRGRRRRGPGPSSSTTPGRPLA